jgi:uncharacterized protein
MRGAVTLLVELAASPTMLRRMTMPEKGAMTVKEAGRKGGQMTKKTQGPDFYKTIGTKGGETTKQRHGPEHYEKIGRKGGQRMSQLVALGKRAQKG